MKQGWAGESTKMKMNNVLSMWHKPEMFLPLYVFLCSSFQCRHDQKTLLLKYYLVGLHLFFSFKPQLLVLSHRFILWPFGPYLRIIGESFPQGLEPPYCPAPSEVERMLCLGWPDHARHTGGKRVKKELTLIRGGPGRPLAQPGSVSVEPWLIPGMTTTLWCLWYGLRTRFCV